MESGSQITQELEELIQGIGDETFSIQAFNKELEKEIDGLKIDERNLAGYICKRFGSNRGHGPPKN